MINVVLAAGYATRLGELTKNFPKPLLKIGNSTILGRMLDDIDNIDDITEHVIVTNHRFTPIFEEWVKTPSGSPCLGGRLVGVGGRYKKPITIIDDGSTANDNRLGAVRDLLLVMEKTPSSSPCLGGEKESSLNREDIGGSDLLVVAVSDGRNYVVVPDGLDAPAIDAPDTFIIKKPLTSIYLAASAVMCQFDELGAVDKISLSANSFIRPVGIQGAITAHEPRVDVCFHVFICVSNVWQYDSVIERRDIPAEQTPQHRRACAG